MAKYKLQIGDIEVELEGETRDEAIKKAGLNPKLWQQKTGVNMEIKKHQESMNKNLQWLTLQKRS